jgi:hypothetical protein
MDWYYLIHKYNTKSSRAKLGDTGKKSTIDLGPSHHFYDVTIPSAE